MDDQRAGRALPATVRLIAENAIGAHSVRRRSRDQYQTTSQGHESSSRPGRLAVTSATTALLLAASLVACGDGSGDGNDDDSGTVTLTWYATAIDQNQFDYRQLLIDEFQDAYPAIKIDLVSPQVDNTDAIRDELREMLPGDAAPDVYLGDVIWPAEFAEAGLARPLDGDFDAAFWDRFPPELSSPMRYQDKTYAVPFFATQAILYYRKDLMPAGPRRRGTVSSPRRTRCCGKGRSSTGSFGRAPGTRA